MKRRSLTMAGMGMAWIFLSVQADVRGEERASASETLTNGSVKIVFVSVLPNRDGSNKFSVSINGTRIYYVKLGEPVEDFKVVKYEKTITKDPADPQKPDIVTEKLEIEKDGKTFEVVKGKPYYYKP